MTLKKILPWWPLLLILLLIGAALYILRTPSYFRMPTGEINLQNNPMPLIGKNHSSSTLPILADHMPEFMGITKWWNTADGQPLTPEKLKGKVVLIDFWTYSCINCIRTQPVLKKWWETYEKDGLVIVGVHTPEFAFEKDPKNVGQAIANAGLKFPIALDPDYGTWNAYGNNAWPAEYLFDREGRLRHVHFGEGEYDQSEQAMRDLLSAGGTVTESPTGADTTPDFNMIKTPETYFGYARAESFANQSELKRDTASTYTIKKIGQNEWSLGGKWKITSESATALEVNDVFQMSVDTNAMHIVLGPTDGSSPGARHIQILIDGKNPTDQEMTSDISRDATGAVSINITEQRLYRIAQFPDGGKHVVELKIIDSNINFYAATFGE